MEAMIAWVWVTCDTYQHTPSPPDCPMLAMMVVVWEKTGCDHGCTCTSHWEHRSVHSATAGLLKSTLRFARREVKQFPKLFLKWRVMHLTMLCHEKRRRSLTLLDYVHASGGEQNSVVGWDVLLASYPGLLTPVFVACSTNTGEGLVEVITRNDVPGRWVDVWRSGTFPEKL